MYLFFGVCVCVCGGGLRWDVVSGSGFDFLIECIDKAERLLAEAAGYGAQLVVFPEAFVGEIGRAHV